MIIETLKLTALFLLVFIVMRLLGKTLLSQWTAYDLVTIVFLSYSALGAVKVQGFLHAVICIVLIGILYMSLSRLSLHESLTRFIIGQPTILIKNGEIIQKSLKQIRYSITELLASLRSLGYPDIQDIEYALLEPNGHLSIIPKQQLRPLTPKDLNIESTYKGLPLTVIVDGRINHENLHFIQRTEQWLEKELEYKGYHDLTKVFFAYVKDCNTPHSLTVFPYKS